MIGVWIAVAGGAGAALRFVVDGLVRARVRSSLPVGTVVVNVSGSFLLGLVVGAVLFGSAAASMQSIVGTGLLGGYTTFSTAGLETVRLIEARELRAALVNLAGTAVLSIAAAAAGLWIAYLV